MQTYKINISPTVSNVVEANSLEEAIKKTKAEIAKGSLSKLYDDLFFDYETGVPDKSLRRKLARMETPVEQDNLLSNIVGSDGFVRNTKMQLALTPKGLERLGLPFDKIRLNDGSTLGVNKIIDERSFGFKTGDAADFMGIVGPIAGAILAFSPQARILKGITALTGNKKYLRNLLTAGTGTAAGKGAEEIIDAAEGFQLQERDEIAKLLAGEFALGAAGQGLGDAIGAGFKGIIGTKLSGKENFLNKRIVNQSAKGRSISDIQKLDRNLGRIASEKEIKDAIKAGKVRLTSVPFKAAQATFGKPLMARSQQIVETVTGDKRIGPNVQFLAEELENVTGLINDESVLLKTLVDDLTVGDIVTSVDDVALKYDQTQKQATKKLTELLEEIAETTYGSKNFKNVLGNRQMGETFQNTLVNARRAINKEIGMDYNAVDAIFDSIADDGVNNAINVTVNQVIKKYMDEALDIIEVHKSNPFWDVNAKPGDLDSGTIVNLERSLQRIQKKSEKFLQNQKNRDRLLDDPSDFDEDFVPVSGIQGSTLTDIRNAISDLRILKNLEITPKVEKKTISRILRKLDDSDIKGDDSILTSLEKNGNRIITFNVAEYNAANKLSGALKARLNDPDKLKLDTAIKLLRIANDKNRARLQPYDDVLLKKVSSEAEVSGAADPDKIFNDLIINGSTRNLEDFFDALSQYDTYLRTIGQAPEQANNVNFIKNEIRKRLFNDAFRTATNVNTGDVNFTQFVRQINKFENQNPGKLDILFSDIGGASVAQNFRQTMKQLLEIDPKFKSTEIKRLIRSLPDETGLTATQTGLEFIEGLKTLAREADINEKFIRNKALSTLPEKPVDEIVTSIFRPQNANNINFIKLQVDDATFAQIQDAAMVKLLENSIDFGNQGLGKITDIFKFKSLDTALKKYGDDTLDAMFGKETRLGLQDLAKNIDILTSGEPGRLGVAGGGIVAGAIGASVIFNPLSALGILPGLFITKYFLSRPTLIKALTKTDRNSITLVTETFNRLLSQLTARGIGEGIDEGREQAELLQNQLLQTEQAQQFKDDLSNFAPQQNITYPEIQPIPDQLELDRQARREFAEQLFRRPII